MSYFLAGSAAVTAGIGIYHTIKGASDSAAAKKRAAMNIRPSYNIADEYFNNQSLAGNLAQGGLTDSAKNFYESNAERGLGSSLGAALATGGGINDVQRLYDTFDHNNQQIAATDSQQKVDNIKYLMGVNNQLADQKTQAWTLNKYQPYLDNAKSIAAQKSQGTAEVNSGLESISGAASAYASGSANKADSVGKGGGSVGNIWNNSGQDQYNAEQFSNPNSYINTQTSNTAGFTDTPVVPAATRTIATPDSFDALPSYQDSARQIAMGDIMSKYKNSPYANGLSTYLQSA